MKIDKTEKEWRFEVSGHLPAKWTEAERLQVAAAIAQGVGLEFKEEEPELPESLRLVEYAGSTAVDVLDGFNQLLVRAQVHGRRGRAVYREAAARYNFFHRLNLDSHDGGDFTLALLRKLIREERERLQ